MKTLGEVNVGGAATVLRIHGDGPVRRRILDMGITKGAGVAIRRVAPFGDPMEVTVRGYELSIRRADALRIEIR